MEPDFLDERVDVDSYKFNIPFLISICEQMERGSERKAPSLTVCAPLYIASEGKCPYRNMCFVRFQYDFVSTKY